MSGLYLVLPLAIITITGNILRAKGFYSNKEISVLTKTLYWVILPPLLFRTSFMSGSELFRQPNLFIAANVCYITTIAITWILAKKFVHRDNKKRLAVSLMASIRSNNVYLGFPVVTLAMGEVGLHSASIYIAVTTVSFQTFSLLVGELGMSGKMSGAALKQILKRVARNPLIISCAAGVGAASAGVPMPQFIDEALRLMGAAATGIALLALGGSLDFSSARVICNSLRDTWFDDIIKILVHPMIMWTCLMIWPVSEDLMKVTVMLSTMPSAVNVFVLSKEMGMDHEYGANLVASTMVIALISIPVWAHILQL
jgi:malonate transporter